MDRTFHSANDKEALDSYTTLNCLRCFSVTCPPYNGTEYSHCRQVWEAKQHTSVLNREGSLLDLHGFLAQQSYCHFKLNLGIPKPKHAVDGCFLHALIRVELVWLAIETTCVILSRTPHSDLHII